MRHASAEGRICIAVVEISRIQDTTNDLLVWPLVEYLADSGYMVEQIFVRDGFDV